MANEQLNDYVQKARQSGMSDGQIKAELLKVGWTQEQAEVAIVGLSGISEHTRHRSFVPVVIGVLGVMVLGSLAFGAYYIYSQPNGLQVAEKSALQNDNGVAPAPSADSIIANAQYGQYADCLKRQDWYTHEIAMSDDTLFDFLRGALSQKMIAHAQVSIDFPDEFGGMPLPQYKENPCQSLALTSDDPGLLAYLSQSVDPIIQITLAQNPFVPHDIQMQIYNARLTLPMVWDDIDETASHNRSITPQQWVVSNFAQNVGIMPAIMDDMVQQYREKGNTFLEMRKVAWMLHDPEDGDTRSAVSNMTHSGKEVVITSPTQQLLSLINELVRLNDPEFNIDVSRDGVLSEEIIRYLAQQSEYDWPQKTRPSRYQFVDTPYQEIRENLRMFQRNVPKDIVISFFADLRTCDFIHCEMHPGSLAKVEKELLSAVTIRIFIDGAATTETQDRIDNYMTQVLNLSTSPKYYEYARRASRPEVETSSETLQLIITTFRDPVILALIGAYGKRDADQAIASAQKELDRRSWVPPSQRTLVWNLASWWELEDARHDSIGKCDDGTTYHEGRKVYLMSLGVGYEWVDPNSKEREDAVIAKVISDGWKLCGDNETEKVPTYQQVSYDKTYIKDGYLLTIRTFPNERQLNYAFEYTP